MSIHENATSFELLFGHVMNSSEFLQSVCNETAFSFTGIVIKQKLSSQITCVFMQLYLLVVLATIDLFTVMMFVIMDTLVVVIPLLASFAVVNVMYSAIANAWRRGVRCYDDIKN